MTTHLTKSHPVILLHGRPEETFRQAISLAQSIWCPSRCGACGSCMSIDRQQWPGLLIISGDKTITRSDVQPVFDHLFYATIEDPFVAIICHADRLVTSAASALLKLFEEPPLGSFYLLTSTAKDQMMPTIVSRCLVHEVATNASASQESNYSSWYALLAHPCHLKYGQCLALLQKPIPNEHELRLLSRDMAEFWASHASGTGVSLISWWLDAANNGIPAGSGKLFLRQAYSVSVRTVCKR